MSSSFNTGAQSHLWQPLKVAQPEMLAIFIMHTYNVVPPSAHDTLQSLFNTSDCDTVRTYAKNGEATARQLGFPHCRTEYPSFHWCKLAKKQQRDTPSQISGWLPCKLKNALQNLEFYGKASKVSEARTENCLRNKRMAVLGDSTLREWTTELILMLSMDNPDFAYDYLTMEVKSKMATGARGFSHGHLTLNITGLGTNHMTFYDSRLNFTVMYEFAGHWLEGANYGGIRTASHPLFKDRLHRLGLLPDSQQYPDILITGSTFHDDAKLSVNCPPDSCSCNTTWPSMLNALRDDAREFASLLESVRARGTRVIFNTLFGRAQNDGEFDPLRAVDDGLLVEELTRIGFVGAPNAFINDQWALYSAYFNLSKAKLAHFGPSSIHYSTSSVRDWFIQPDLGAMRVQLVLNHLCNPDFQFRQTTFPKSPYYFSPQKDFLLSTEAQCSCGWHTMSINQADLCSTRRENLASKSKWKKYKVQQGITII